MSHKFDTKDTIRWDKAAADADDADATAEHLIFRAPYALLITGVRYLPDDALTADNSNYAFIQVTRRDADGTNDVYAARGTTTVAGTGSWTQWNAVTIPLAAVGGGGEPNDAVKLTEGQTLTFLIQKIGDGVIVPSGTLQIDFLKM